MFGAVHAQFGAFSPTYLQVVDAHRTTVSSGHVVVHTLPKAAQTGRFRVVAGLRAWWGSQQKTAWTGGVLAWALALGLLQRRRPAGQEVQICVFFKWTGRGINGNELIFFLKYLAEQISEGLAWQNSLVHSGWQLSGSAVSITTQHTLETNRSLNITPIWDWIHRVDMFFKNFCKAVTSDHNL